MGGLARSAKYDGVEVTQKARDAFLKRFEDEVDPERRLPEKERLRRAEAAKRLYFARLSKLAAKAKAKRARRERRDADAAGLGGPAASQGATEGGDGTQASG